MSSGALQPAILKEGLYTEQDIIALQQQHPDHIFFDIVDNQLTELFEITEPRFLGKPDEEKNFQDFCTDRCAGKPKKMIGDWVYFPGTRRIVHMLTTGEVYRLRTNRNRNLITQAEQELLRAATIGIAGLSVGGSIATALAQSGIGSSFNLCEFDTLATTNLNRVRARLSDVGRPKADIVAENLWDIDPTLNLTFFEKLTPSTIDDFVWRTRQPAVIFEIIDSFVEKILLRKIARERRIPVVMMANLGDSILIDVERYDQFPELPFFNGVVGDVPEEILSNPDISSVLKHQYAVSLVGKEHVPFRALGSVAEIGTTLVGRPQLGSTVTVAGGIGAYIARRIILNQPLPSGRFHVRFEDFFTE